MKSKDKILLAGLMSAALLWTSRALAQTNAPAAPLPVGEAENIVLASLHQVANNPASLTVILFLCVLAWLADDTPFINSRYVPHLTVTIGACIYWLFAGPSSVPSNFPYPKAVFVVNGTLCGFVAFLVHRQAVARAIAFFRVKSGGAVDTSFLRKPNNPNQP